VGLATPPHATETSTPTQENITRQTLTWNPQREEKERPAQELLEKGPGGRRQADQLLLGGARADCTGPWTMAGGCGWPMPHKGLKA
jgi:hypothetical protein